MLTKHPYGAKTRMEKTEKDSELGELIKNLGIVKTGKILPVIEKFREELKHYGGEIPC